MKKAISITLVTLMLLAVLSGCGETSTGGSQSQGTEGLIKIGMCMNSLNHPVHRIAQAGFILKGVELGYDAFAVGLDEGSGHELIAKYESAITNGMVGAAMWTGDDAQYAMMRNLVEQCVFVVPHFAHDYLDTKDFISKNICARASEEGRIAADFMVEQLTARGIKSGVIGLTQSSGNVTENAIADAFRARIRDLGVNYTVASTVYEGLNVFEAATKITGIIQGNANIVGALGTTGGSAQAWLTAMQNTSREELVVVAMDYTEINIDLVSSKAITAVVAQPIYEESEMCAQAIHDIFNGADYTVSESEWFTELDAPVAYAEGEGVHDIESYRPLIRTVIDFYSGKK